MCAKEKYEKKKSEMCKIWINVVLNNNSVDK